VKLDNKMKRLLREMGEAINDSLSASDDLSGTIDRIRQEGYDIFLILEATIGLNPRSAGDGEETSRTLPAARIELTDGTNGDALEIPKDDGENKLVFQVSPDDEQFLRSLRISVEDSGAGSADSDSDTPASEDEGGEEK
jgi:hypothetical protein